MKARTLTFDANWPVFDGHLPGQPMVPGAELIRIAAEVAGSELQRVERFKFVQPVLPSDTVTVTAQPHGRDAGAWDVRVERGETLCAAGRVYLNSL